MKVILGRRVIVSASALVMALAIGATAWAATSTTQATTGPTAVTQSAAPSAGGGMRGLGDVLGGGPGGAPGSGQVQGRPDTAQIQEREQAVLKLVRGEMTSADQAKLDALVAQQKTQSAAVEKAANDLRSTNDQLQTLIDGYLLPAGSTPTTNPTDDAGTTGTTTAPTATTSGATS